MKPKRKPYELLVYQSQRDHLFYWRLTAVRGGKTIGDGAEGYVTRSSARRAVKKCPLDWSKVEVVSK